MAARPAGGQRKQPSRIWLAELHKGRPIGVHFDRRVFVIVEPGTTQLGIIKTKTQGLNQMQPSAGVGAKPDDVAGVGGDFRMNQNDIEHPNSLTIWAN